MIVKIKKVYYCEFCGRHRLRPVTNHENHCTKNPKRECGFCQHNYELPFTEVLTKYQGRAVLREVKQKIGHTVEIDWPKGKFTIQDIQNDVEGCPACTLAVLRICGYYEWPLSEELHFDYQAEVKGWWEEENKEQAGSYY